MKKWVALAVVLGGIVMHGQETASLSGQWTLDRGSSQPSREIGFRPSFVPVAPGARQPPPALPESQEDAARRQQLTADARTPSVNLTIADAQASITITDERQRSRTFHVAPKPDVIQLDAAPVAVTTTRASGRLVVVYKVEDNRDLRYTYSLSLTPPQLIVDVAFLERGVAGDSARYVYVPGTAATTLPPAAVVADSELRGLTKLGVTVEGLTSQAAACGLTQSAVETAVTRSLTDAGLGIVTNMTSTENTYLYVNVVTTHVSADLCVSKYDAFLYTHTTTGLSYHEKPVPVQVELMHTGGLAGGSAASHGDAVVKGVKEYVDAFAAKIRAAN